MTKEILINTRILCEEDQIKRTFEEAIKEGGTKFIIDRNAEGCVNLKELLNALKSIINWKKDTELHICSICNEDTKDSLEEINKAFTQMDFTNIKEIKLSPYTQVFKCEEVNHDHIKGIIKIYKTLASKSVSKIIFDLENTNISDGVLELAENLDNKSKSHLEIIIPDHTLSIVQEDLQKLNIICKSEKIIATHSPEMIEYTYVSDGLTIIGQEEYYTS